MKYSEQRWTEVQPWQFWSRVSIGGIGACWWWTGSRRRDGYGEFFSDPLQLRIRTHRLAWLLTHGAIQNNLCVLHQCDNPRCINPKHLFLGTRQDNNRDKEHKERVPKGRSHWTKSRPERLARGERHGLTSLTEEQVREIRRRHEAGESQSCLAVEFGQYSATISRIVRRVTWGHVT